MPKFDANLWKNTRPDFLEKTSVDGAIKDWHAHCPEKYEDSDDNPQKLVAAATLAVKKFQAAIHEAEGKLAKDNSKDAKVKASIGKTKALLTKWETEAAQYLKEVTKWSQETIKAEQRGELGLKKAQDHFAAVMKAEGQKIFAEMETISKTFDAALKAQDANAMGAKLGLHRKLLLEAQAMIRPVTIAKMRDQIAAKFNVQSSEIVNPPSLHEFAKKAGAADARDDEMDELFGRARQGDFPDESEEKISPEAKKALREGLAAYKTIVTKLKAKASFASSLVQQILNVCKVSVEGDEYRDAMVTARDVNMKLFLAKKDARALLVQVQGNNAPLWKKVLGAGVKEAEAKRVLVQEANIALAYCKSLTLSVESCNTLLMGWMERVLKAHPDALEVKTEMANLKGKYQIKLI